MVRRNHRAADKNDSSNGLAPCRQAVDARDAKRALKAFIAACGKAAATATVAVAISSTNVSCKARSEPVPLMGEVMLTRITTQPAEECDPEMTHPPMTGILVPAQIITQPETRETDVIMLEGEPAAIMIVPPGGPAPAELILEPAEEETIEAMEEEEEELEAESKNLRGDVVGTRIITRPVS